MNNPFSLTAVVDRFAFCNREKELEGRDADMNSQRVKKAPNPSFRRKPESSEFKYFWIPDQVRDDGDEVFYEFITIEY